MGLFWDPFFLPLLNHPISPQRKKQLTQYLSSISVPFNNLNFFHLALIHKSFSNENPNTSENNERLELLGDSVLSLLTTEYLYKTFPNFNEGKISRIKSYFVSEQTLAKIALDIDLSLLLLMGKGETSTGGAKKLGNLANAMEAFLGAFYLDSNLESLRFWFTPFIQKYVIETESKDNQFKDTKTKLQEYSQKHFKTLPLYEIISEQGPDHSKSYEVSVKVGKISAIGTGDSKKKAEKEAARRLWEKLQTRIIQKK